MDGSHAEFLGGRQVARGVVGVDAVRRRDTELFGGDEVDGGVRLAQAGVAGDDHRVEDLVEVVALVGVELALAPRIRQQADPDVRRAGAPDKVQDLGARTQAAERAGEQPVVVDVQQPPDDHLVLALRDAALLDGGERRPAFGVVAQHAGDGVGRESFPDAER